MPPPHCGAHEVDSTLIADAPDIGAFPDRHMADLRTCFICGAGDNLIPGENGAMICAWRPTGESRAPFIRSLRKAGP